MRVVMVGSGYVGLVSGACFSEFGTDIICVDKDVAKIQDLNEGRIPIFEPGLDRMVVHNVEAGRLSFSTDLTAALQGAAAVFIAGALVAVLGLLASGVTPATAFGVGLACAAVATVVEAFSNHGLDNLTIQIAAAGTAFLLLA